MPAELCSSEKLSSQDLSRLGWKPAWLPVRDFALLKRFTSVKLQLASLSVALPGDASCGRFSVSLDACTQRASKNGFTKSRFQLT